MGSDFVNWDRKEGKKHFQIWLILVIRSMAEASCAQGTCLIPAKPACHPYIHIISKNIKTFCCTLSLSFSINLYSCAYTFIRFFKLISFKDVQKASAYVRALHYICLPIHMQQMPGKYGFLFPLCFRLKYKKIILTDSLSF